MATAAQRTAPRATRRLPRAERREVLLQGAARVFARRGYAAAAMEEIASAAGVTKLILYRHFPSKAALYRAVLRREARRLSLGIRSQPEVDGFGVGTRSFLVLAQADKAGFQLLWRHAVREPEFARLASTLRAEIVSVARSSLASRVAPVFLDWAAHAVVGYLVEAVLNWLERGDPAYDEQFVSATNGALRAGVRTWTQLSKAS